MRFILPASPGIVVPSAAMSERSPPWGWGSEEEAMTAVSIGVRFRVPDGIGIDALEMI